MATKKRNRAYRISQEKQHRDKARQDGGPKPGKRTAYEQNKRNAVRASLRDPQGWTW